MIQIEMEMGLLVVNSQMKLLQDEPNHSLKYNKRYILGDE